MPTRTQVERLPKCLLVMLACTWESILLIEETVDARDLDAHELFSGAEAIANAHVLLGLTCLGQDKCKAERHDVIQPVGLTLATWRAMRTKREGWLGLQWIAARFRGSQEARQDEPKQHPAVMCT